MWGHHQLITQFWFDNTKTKGQKHGSLFSKFENLHLTQHCAKTSSPHHEHNEEGGSP
jgi:hypothetical protein